MSKIIALLAIILIISGAIVLAVPREQAETTRSLTPQELTVPGVFVWARDVAEQVQAPLSIAFGLISLYWNRKSYLKNQIK